MMTLKKNLAISDSGFIFDPSTGNSFTTNAIGLTILNQLKNPTTEGELKSEMLDQYEIKSPVLERDLQDFLNVLRKLKLITENEPS